MEMITRSTIVSSKRGYGSELNCSNRGDFPADAEEAPFLTASSHLHLYNENGETCFSHNNEESDSTVPRGNHDGQTTHTHHSC